MYVTISEREREGEQERERDLAWFHRNSKQCLGRLITTASDENPMYTLIVKSVDFLRLVS